MLKIYNIQSLSKQKIEEMQSRCLLDDLAIEMAVKTIIEGVKKEGDQYLTLCNNQYDKYNGNNLFLGLEALKLIAKNIPFNLKNAIDLAAKNIRKFHTAQLHTEQPIETTPGVTCWRENRAIETVGLYIPGGSAILPSTFLMLAIPAIIAGCKNIIVCTPPNSEGLVSQEIAYCALSLGISKIYLTGGAQAIAAMTYGTKTIPKVSKIFGPGNRYVTTAKSILQKFTAIDMPAGPSEVLIIADHSCIPEYVASDLLAQAEHGSDSQTILISTSSKILDEANKALCQQITALPRRKIIEEALKNSYSLLVKSIEQAFQFSNEYAPEHLILAIEDAQKYLEKITNAGSVFIGNLTPESAGDYASGTNHTLPTSGFAKAYSGVSVDSFLKKITFQKISAEGLKNIGPTIEILAEAEGLQAHKNSITIRLNKNGN